MDDTASGAAQPVLQGHWLGLVVPKRHAKRAVTRNLIKRQVRAAMAAHAGALAPGLWVVRLKMPFDRAAFRSPASAGLREAARAELAQLFGRAAAPASGQGSRPADKPSARAATRASAPPSTGERRL